MRAGKEKAKKAYEKNILAGFICLGDDCLVFLLQRQV